MREIKPKGKQLHIEDVRARLPKRPDGSPASDWTVRKVMVEVGKFRIGKYDYVHEADLEAWLASQGEEH